MIDRKIDRKIDSKIDRKTDIKIKKDSNIDVMILIDKNRSM